MAVIGTSEPRIHRAKPSWRYPYARYGSNERCGPDPGSSASDAAGAEWACVGADFFEGAGEGFDVLVGEVL